MSHLDDTAITDFDTEIARFDDLLGAASGCRVMVVSGQPGVGKTVLLRKIRLHCLRDLGVPAALVNLKEFVNRPEEYELVTALRRELRKAGIELPRLEDLERNPGRGATAESGASLRGLISMNGATISGQAVVGARIDMVQIQHAETVVLAPRSDADEASARSERIAAFLVDLAEHGRTTPLVLLFDSLESGEDLRRWILVEIVANLVLKSPERPRLTVVIAGNDAAGLVLGRLRQADHVLVDCVDSFNPWTEAQIMAFLAAHGHRNVTPELLSVIGATERHFDRLRALTVAKVLSNPPDQP